MANVFDMDWSAPRGKELHAGTWKPEEEKTREAEEEDTVEPSDPKVRLAAALSRMQVFTACVSDQLRVDGQLNQISTRAFRFHEESVGGI